MVKVRESWVALGSVIGSLVFVRAIFRDFFSSSLWAYIQRRINKLVLHVYPYTTVIFDEFTDERRLRRSDVFSQIQSYLSSNALGPKVARKFKADVVKGSKFVRLNLDDGQEVTDEFEGVQVWWVLFKIRPRRENSISMYPPPDEKRSYRLTFHKRHLELIQTSYIRHVLKSGKATMAKNRKRKLYSNNPSKNWFRGRQTMWSHLLFKHPATFDTLAMDTKKKEEIKNDLLNFSQGKEYYKKIGKAWKRGYLLYGPPGTGKSTMVAAMANFLDFDIYDLELTTVLDNTELRSLLIDVPGKSILVIEDIDCSLDLTGQRQKKKENDGGKSEMDAIKKKAKEESESKQSQVTLSGLLNVIDGLWSACGGERIIVFTTNYVDKLDPALIRRGRMDKHIEMSYCCFDAFKVLAKNYLDVDSHELNAEIGGLLAETNMTPADVAENLMPKSVDREDAETCFKNLIEALKVAKEDQARKKAEQEARLKAEKEEKDKKKCAEENVKHEETSASSVKENAFKDKEDEEGEALILNVVGNSSN